MTKIDRTIPNWYIKTFSDDTDAYAILSEFAKKASEALSYTGTRFEVNDTYFDFGQNWMWTTLIAYNKNSFSRSWQAFCPTYQKMVLEGDWDTVISRIEEYCSKYAA